MKLSFESPDRRAPWLDVPPENWSDWRWQMRTALVTPKDFAEAFDLSEDERLGLEASGSLFRVMTTPYYANLASKVSAGDPIRRIFMPLVQETLQGHQQMLDPLGEKKNLAAPRIVHRYSDRVLFWVTDTCSVYCRYCTRKHFTASGQAAVAQDEYEAALHYIQNHDGIREVILSGGDPLTLSDDRLLQIVEDLSNIPHIELIRIGSRMPVVNPMRITESLVSRLKRFHPIYIMTHFNHPRELTAEAAQALTLFADHGFPLFNQMVLLNGVNNHPAIIQALSRRLLRLRVKPYYMFQCDPSLGTDHLRTSVEQSLEIQKELWGHLSGLAMPSLSLDIPDGGGKATLVPNFQVSRDDRVRHFRGWDGVEADYVSPPSDFLRKPEDVSFYQKEWDQLQSAKAPKSSRDERT